MLYWLISRFSCQFINLKWCFYIAYSPKVLSSHFPLQVHNTTISQCFFSSQPLTPPPSSLSADGLAFHFTGNTEALKTSCVVLSSNLPASLHLYPYVRCSSVTYCLISVWKPTLGATPICLLKSLAPTFSPHGHCKYLSLNGPILITIQTCCKFFPLKKKILPYTNVPSDYYTFSLLPFITPLLPSWSSVSLSVTSHHLIEATFVKISTDLILSYPMVRLSLPRT